MIKGNNKGIALMLVLGTILFVVILANVVLSIISSQSRLTHHQVSRIQGYYAAQAGMVYALERLRVGNWSVGVDCTDPAGCSLASLDPDFRNPSTPNMSFPNTISDVNIIIRPPQSTLGLPCYNPPGNTASYTACVSSRAIYTYTSPQ